MYCEHATTSGVTSKMLTDLASAMRGQIIEGLRIHDARADIKIGAELEPFVRVYTVVDDPEPGERTWKFSVNRAIQNEAKNVAEKLGISIWTEVWFTSLSSSLENR